MLIVEFYYSETNGIFSTPTMATSEELLVCSACGTQFDASADRPLSNCRICDVGLQFPFGISTNVLNFGLKDPRQFVPPQGQAWTSLKQLMEDEHVNKWQRDTVDDRMWSIWTEPKVRF